MRTAPAIPQAILYASAFIIAALVIITAGRLPENSAHANMAAVGTGGYTLVTATSGFGPSDQPYEILYVIDNQTQTLFIYAVDNAADRRVLLRTGASLPNLFRTARGG